MPFLLLFLITICDLTFSGRDYTQFKSVEIQKDQEICFNSTRFPIYLLLTFMEGEAEIYHYRNSRYAQETVFIYREKIVQIPAVYQSYITCSSYTIHAFTKLELHFTMFCSYLTSNKAYVSTYGYNDIWLSSDAEAEDQKIIPHTIRTFIFTGPSMWEFTVNLSLPSSSLFYYSHPREFQRFTGDINFSLRSNENYPLILLLSAGSPNEKQSFVHIEAKALDNNFSRFAMMIGSRKILQYPEKTPSLELVITENKIDERIMKVALISLGVLLGLMVFFAIRYGSAVKYCHSFHLNEFVGQTRLLMPSQLIDVNEFDRKQGNS